MSQLAKITAGFSLPMMLAFRKPESQRKTREELFFQTTTDEEDRAKENATKLRVI